MSWASQHQLMLGILLIFMGSRCQPRAEAIFQSHFLQMFPDNFNLSRGSDIINPVWMEQVNSCHLDLVGHLCYLE